MAKLYRQNASYGEILADGNENQEAEESNVTHGNTGLPFGLCKKYGISLPNNATPRDAWDALKGIGITPEEVYEELRAKQTEKRHNAEKIYDSEKQQNNNFTRPNVERIRAKFGENHTENISRILAQHPQQTELYNKYSNKLKVGNQKNGMGDYSPLRGVNFNLENDAKPASPHKGNPYATYFHETAHNIDNLASGSIIEFASASYESAKYGMTLSQMIIEEAKSYIDQRRKERGFKRAADVYLELSVELGKIPYCDSGAVSDMFSGVTKHGVMGHGSHSKSYFADKNNFGIEFFAECYSDELCSPKGKENTKKYFPKSYEIYEEVKNFILNKE